MVISVNQIIMNNLTNEKIEELSMIEQVLLHAMSKEKLQDTCFDIILVDNSYIHQLNKEYRGVDRETDVITFALNDDSMVLNGSHENILGDIYISVERARFQAEEYGHSFLRELSFLAVHGFYHLLGYDHINKDDEKIMFQKQEEVLQEYGITR